MNAMRIMGSSSFALSNGASQSGSTRTPRPRSAFGNSDSSRSAAVDIAACARATLTPGARTANPSIHRADRSSSWYVPLNAACIDAGTQNCIA